MSNEFKPTVPRLKAAPLASNPEILVGIGEKGGVSLYIKGQRFPVTLYWDQWQMVLAEEVIGEINDFANEHRELLADGKPAKAVKDVEDRTFNVSAAEMALVTAEANRLTEAGDMKGAVKFATIKAIAESGQKVGFAALQDIMLLKARK